MSGTIHVLRPNEEGINNAGAYSAFSSPIPGSLAAATADDSDTSYMAGTGTGTVVLGFTGYSLLATERVLRARVRVRAIGPALGTQTVFVWSTFGNFADGDWHAEDVAGIGAGPTVFTGTWHTQWAAGGEITQALLTKIQTKVRSSLASGTTAAIFEQYIDAEVVVQPSLNITGPTGTNPGATHRPTVNWTPTIGDGFAQKKYRIKVFDKAQNPSPSWANTLGLVWDSGAILGAATGKRIDHTLRNSDYRVLMQVAKDFNGTDWWSTTDSIDFTIADQPPVPTQIGPTGTILTGLPNLQARASISSLAYATGSYVEWQVATDAAFTTNVRQFIELSPSELAIFQAVVNTNGTGGPGPGVRYLQTVGAPLEQTVWYLRARTHDFTGGVSAYSTAVTFTVAHAPSAVGISPAAGSYVQATVQGYEWEFVAWAPTETQTAYQLLVTDPVGTIIADTGKVETDVPSTATAINTEQPAVWQVRVWDDSDVVSAYSDPIVFNIAVLPVVTFVTPTPFGAVIIDDTPTVTWTYSSPAARAQASWRLFVTDEASGETVYDSGVTLGAATSVTLPEAIVNGHNYTFTLEITDTAGVPVVAHAYATITTFAPPSAPTNVDATQITVPNRPLLTGRLSIADIQIVQLVWDATGLGDRFAHYEVQRFDQGAWVTVAQVADEDTPFFFDVECWRSTAGYANAYQVRVVEIVRGPSSWVAFVPVTVTTLNDTDLVFSSNFTPALTVAYQDRPGYEFGTDDPAAVKVARMYGNATPSAFRAPDRRGDQFGRTLIVAAHDPEVSAVDDSGRAVFDPLLERCRDTFSPYVCVTDGMGHRWLVSLTFVKGSYRKTVELYTADVNFVEVAEAPVPAVTSVTVP